MAQGPIALGMIVLTGPLGAERLADLTIVIGLKMLRLSDLIFQLVDEPIDQDFHASDCIKVNAPILPSRTAFISQEYFSSQDNLSPLI